MRSRWFRAPGLLVAVCLLAFVAKAERKDPTFRLMASYSTVANVKDAGSQNFAIEEDSRGMIYIGNLSGVVEYDGEWWRLIKLPNDNSANALEALPDGRIATGGYNEIGYLEQDERGTMRYHSLMDLVPKEPEIGELISVRSTSQGVVFYTSSLMLLWHDGAIEVLAEMDLDEDFWRDFPIDDTVWFHTKKGILRLVDRKLEPVPGGELYADRKLRMIAPWDDENVLIYIRQTGFYLFDGEKETPIAEQAWEAAREAFPYAGFWMQDGRLAIVTLSGGVFILSRSGDVDEVIDTSTGLPDSDISNALLASDGSLWLVMDNNVTRVEATSPLTIIDTRGGLRGTPVSIKRHLGQLYVGTTSGFFRVSAEGMDLTKTDRKVATSLGSELWDGWSMLSVGDDLLAGTGNGIFVIDAGGKPTVIEGTDKALAYCLVESAFHSNRVWVGTTEGFGTLERVDGRWKWMGHIEDMPSSVRSVVEISGTELWLGTSYDGAVRATLEEGQPPRLEKFSTSEMNVYRVGGRVVFTSEKTHILQLDEIKGEFVPDSVLGAMTNESIIFTLAEDQTGNVWVNSQPAGVARRQADGSFEFDDRLLLGLPGRDIQVIYVDDDGVIWFGTDHGLVRFDANGTWSVTEPRTPSIHQVTVGGEPVEQHGGAVEIGPDAGRLRFEVTGISFERKVQYRHRLEPLETAWSPWSSEPTTEYTNLWEGDYTFHVESRSPRGEVSPSRTWTFRILPPWYRTGAAYTIWILLALGALVGGPILRNRALRQRAKILEQRVAEQTEELQENVAKLAFANECLELMSRNDPLTGIPNRREFDQRLREEWSRARRAQSTIGFILIDLDLFKLLNDSLGHHAGDICLQKLGSYLAESMRRTGDLVARLGGEEFAMILPNTDVEGCVHLAEQMRVGVMELDVDHPASPFGKVTASFGVASIVPQEGQESSELIVAADRALYRAKDEGRNCVRADEGNRESGASVEG